MNRAILASSERRVTFTAGDGLGRSAFQSEGDRHGGGPAPVLLVIHGLAGTTAPSGPPVMPKLVETLNDHGIGTMRYLPRVYELFSERPGEVDWNAEISDASGALELLRRKGREIYLLGLSLGGIVAPIAACAVGGVKGIASYGSTARPWAEYSIENLAVQLRWMESPTTKVERLSELERVWQELLRDTELGGAEIIEREPALKAIGVSKEGRYERSASYWRQVARCLPAEGYRGLSCRILALRGGADACCHASDLESTIAAACAAGLEVERAVIPDLDHGLRLAAGPAESLRGDVSAEPHPEMLAHAVANWIKRAAPPGR